MTKKALLFGLAILATGSGVVSANPPEEKIYDKILKEADNVGRNFGADDLTRFAQILSLDSTDEDIIRLVNGLSVGVKGLRLVRQVLRPASKRDSVKDSDGSVVEGASLTTYDFLNPEFSVNGSGEITARMTALIDAASIYNDVRMVKEAKHLAANNKRRPVETPLEVQPGMLEAKVGIVGKTALFVEGIAAMGLNYWAGKCSKNKSAKSLLVGLAYLLKGIQRYQIWAKQNKRLKEVKEQLEQQGIVSAN